KTEDVVALTVEQIENAIAAGKIDISVIQKIGIAFAGPVDSETGVAGTPFDAPNLPFDHYALCDELESILEHKYSRHIPVEILNDCAAAVMGEISVKGGLYKYGCGTAMIIGTGINGTAARGGKPYYGLNEEIKELGHNLVPTAILPSQYSRSAGTYTYTGHQTLGDHPKDEEGNNLKGDFEDSLAGPALDRRFQAQGYTLRNITDKAKAGDVKAVALIQEAGRDIGHVMAAYIYAYKNEDFVRHIILVSGVSENLGLGVEGDPFITSVRQGAKEDLMKSGLAEEEADELVSGIERSRLTYEREFVAFTPDFILPETKALSVAATIDPAKTILFGVSGGDCPGLNSVLSGLAQAAAKEGLQVATLEGGFKTLCSSPEEFAKGLRIIKQDEIAALADMPSIISGSSRVKISEKNQANAIANVQGYYAVVLVGGDDHARQAGKLAELLKENGVEVPVFAVLKTVDNDTNASPIGADTAIEHARMDFLSTCVTAWAHKRISVFEVMGRERGWVTVGAGDIRISERDRKIPGMVWALTQTAGSVINLIPERTSYLVDFLVEVINRIAGNEISYDANLLPIREAIRLYANINICEGYQFRDFAPEHREARDTLFYRLLELDPELKEKFYAAREYDIHGNPKLAGLYVFVASAIKYIPELANSDPKLMSAVSALRQKLQDLGIPEKEVFGKEGEREIISGVRPNMPNFIIRGLAPNKYDRCYGLNIGKRAFAAAKKARQEINRGRELVTTGLAIALDKKQNALKIKPALWPIDEAARGVEVTETYSDMQLREMGIWWSEPSDPARRLPKKPMPSAQKVRNEVLRHNIGKFTVISPAVLDIAIKYLES
ncbi:MAG: ROK family protein, partial [Candidatus Omnitrophota bacterium]